MSINNLPNDVQVVIQTNMLERRFWEQLSAQLSYRNAAFRYPVEKRMGETMIYSRAGRITPVMAPMSASGNTGLDNGLSNIPGIGANAPAYPFEQWSVNINQYAYTLDLNTVQDELTVSSIFKQNVDNLAEAAALTLDLLAAKKLFTAYESGNTWVTAGTTAVTTAHVDNVVGFDTAFATNTITNPGDGNTYTFPYGQPQSTSTTYPVTATVFPAAGGATRTVTVTGVAVDGSNTSTAQAGKVVTGKSGTLTFSAAQTFAVGDVLVAADAPKVIWPNAKQSRFALTGADTNGVQLIINAVAELRKNRIPTVADGTYVCFIDPTMEAQFFTDQQFQIMTQGEEQSPTFKNGRISRNFGVTFVPVTNAPVYGPFTNSAGNPIYTHRAIIMGRQALMDCPFNGTFDALRRTQDGNAIIRVVNDIVMVTRDALDRLQQEITQSYYWIGDFGVPTDATITRDVIPSATAARYKRAIVVEVAAAS